MRVLVVVAALIVAAGAAAARDMNISQFVFRDLNRNGVFDLGESPFAGAPIKLEQAGQDPIVRRSNLSGFANFPMSDDEEDADIQAAGPVSFTISLPDGYDLTTPDLVNHAEITALDAAPSGFVMTPANPFFGIAPALTIEASAESLATMECTAKGARITAVRTGRKLVCPVSAGDWEVSWVLADGSEGARVVTVGDWPVHISLAGAETLPKATTVEGFEGIISSENIQEMPSSGGFFWHNVVAAHRKFYGGRGYVNGTASGEFSGYTSSGHPARLSSADPFTFQGALITVAWPKATRQPVRLTGLRDGAVVAEEVFFGSNLRPVWFDAGWAGIDTLIIGHDAYWQVVIDDVTLSR